MDKNQILLFGFGDESFGHFYVLYQGLYHKIKKQVILDSLIVYDPLPQLPYVKQIEWNTISCKTVDIISITVKSNKSKDH